MYRLKVSKAWWSIDAEGTIVSFRTKDTQMARALCEVVTEGYEAVIDKEKKKRSLQANAFAWELICKIAEKNNLSKEDVYLDMLRHYGQRVEVAIKSDIDVKPYFKHYDKEGEGYMCGEHYIYYNVYRGSSEYTSNQMQKFISGVVQEAKNLGIETLPPDELEWMYEQANKVNRHIAKGQEDSI